MQANQAKAQINPPQATAQMNHTTDHYFLGGRTGKSTHAQNRPQISRIQLIITMTATAIHILIHKQLTSHFKQSQSQLKRQINFKKTQH